MMLSILGTHWLVSLVATLLAQCLLVRESEPPVPRHEVSRVMDLDSLLDVNDDKIVELEIKGLIRLGFLTYRHRSTHTRPRAGRNIGGCPGW